MALKSSIFIRSTTNKKVDNVEDKDQNLNNNVEVTTFFL